MMNQRIILLLVQVVAIVGIVKCTNDKLREVFSWKLIDFAFPNETVKQESVKSGQYIQQHNLPLGLAAWNDKLFITLPRWKAGIPATLTYVHLPNNKTRSSRNKSPKLIPYPSLEANDIESKDGIASVFRLSVDVCDRLWLVDTGVVDILGDRRSVHKPKIQIYDLKTDTLYRQYFIKTEHIKESSFFANIISDVADVNSCNDAYAYIADILSYSIIVYSLAKNDSWRITHNFFHFDPLAGNFNIAGQNFQWEDGIFGLALSKKQQDGYRTLYFHPMCSNKEFSVSTKALQSNEYSYYDFHILGSRGPNSQSSSSAFDEKTGVLFYTLISKDGVGCWNSNNTEYSADTNDVIATDGETLVFPNDLKVDFNGNLWVLTDRLPLMIYSTLNHSDVNYRIFKASTEQAIKSTNCQITQL